MNKKGIEPIVAIILAIIVGAFAIYFAVRITSTIGGVGIGDELCRFNNKVIDKIIGHPDGLRIFCDSKSVTIRADDWEACDPSGIFGYETSANYEDCAAEQIYHLMGRCWYMYGEGDWDLTSICEGWTCFNIEVRSPEEVSINERDITDIMIDHGYCGEGETSTGIIQMENDDCDYSLTEDGGCGSCSGGDDIGGSIAYGGILSGITVSAGQNIDEGEKWRIKFIDEIDATEFFLDDDKIFLTQTDDFFADCD
jgi:hypothetical protein